jgi:uncharacterized protein
MSLQERIDAFFESGPWAVVGASTDRAKYGNKVLRSYQQVDRTVYPVNPKAEEVEGLKAYPDLKSLPEPVHGVSIITPPKVTERIVEEAAAAGIKHLWMQPGAESEAAVSKAEALGLSVIAGDACVLVVQGYHEH